MKLQRYLNHAALDIYFKQSKDDFVVDEIPLYEFSGQGEHLIVKVRKKDLTTWDMVNILADHTGCKSRDIGYAGLKDKNALTVQYISLHKQFEDKIDSFEHSQIKILEKTYHNNKIRVGHLKGNRFFIRLKRVQEIHRKILEDALEQIACFGMPNYFGFQRFGIEGDNYLKGEAICKGEKKERNRKLRQMYINAYQSYQFNLWLSKRIEISKIINSFSIDEIAGQFSICRESLKKLKKEKHPFKLLQGDLMSHYPYGKIFYCEDIKSEAQKFFAKDRVPTGLLSGKKARMAVGDAAQFEEQFRVQTDEQGSRRFAWVFPQNIQSEYKEEKGWFELSFELPKGSYATELIAELIH
jgi:tRNA pseudouridine13 synthase